MRLGITSIQRDRAPWIKEWVAFHYLVGFRQFYIFLHNCSDNTEQILRDLGKKIDIKIFTVDPNLISPQTKCYQSSYNQFGDKVDWMAFIDADEFLFPSSRLTMKTVFEEFKDNNFSALGVYWSCFGSSGFIEEPEGLIIENYKYRAIDGYENNRHIKSVVRGKQGNLIFSKDPHLFQTPLGTIDENLRPITAGWTDYEPTYSKVRINHYVTQSRSFFLSFKTKFKTPDGSQVRDQAYWDEHNRNDVLDSSMVRFIDPVKELMSSL